MATHPPQPDPQADAPAEEAVLRVRSLAQGLGPILQQEAWPGAEAEALGRAAGHALGSLEATLHQGQACAVLLSDHWPHWGEAAWGLPWAWQAPTGLSWRLQGGPRPKVEAFQGGAALPLPPEAQPEPGADWSPWRAALLEAKGGLGGKLPLEGPAALAATLPPLTQAPDLSLHWGPDAEEAEAKLGAARASLARASSEAEEAEALRPAPAPEGWWGWWRRWREAPRRRAADAAQAQLAAAQEALRQAELRAQATRLAVVEAALVVQAQGEAQAAQVALRQRVALALAQEPSQVVVSGLLPEWPPHLGVAGGPGPWTADGLWIVDTAHPPRELPPSDAAVLVAPGGDPAALAGALGRPQAQVWVLPVGLGPKAWVQALALAQAWAWAQACRRALRAAQAAVQAALAQGQAEAKASWASALAEAQPGPWADLAPGHLEAWRQGPWRHAQEAVDTVRGAGWRRLREAQQAEDLVRALEGLAQSDAGDLEAIAGEALLQLARHVHRTHQGLWARRCAELEDRLQALRVRLGAQGAGPPPPDLAAGLPPLAPLLAPPAGDPLALVRAIGQATRPPEGAWADALGRRVAQRMGAMAGAQGDAQGLREAWLDRGLQALGQVLEAQAQAWARLVPEALAEGEGPLLAWHAGRLQALAEAHLQDHAQGGPATRWQALAEALEGKLAELQAAEGQLRAAARGLGLLLS